MVDVLNDFLGKTQTDLDDTRHAESNAARNFAVLRQSLQDQLALDKSLEKATTAKFNKPILRKLERAWFPSAARLCLTTLQRPRKLSAMLARHRLRRHRHHWSA